MIFVVSYISALQIVWHCMVRNPERSRTSHAVLGLDRLCRVVNPRIPPPEPRPGLHVGCHGAGGCAWLGGCVGRHDIAGQSHLFHELVCEMDPSTMVTVQLAHCSTHWHGTHSGVNPEVVPWFPASSHALRRLHVRARGRLDTSLYSTHRCSAVPSCPWDPHANPI
jgi:hypothetical protein